MAFVRTSLDDVVLALSAAQFSFMGGGELPSPFADSARKPELFKVAKPIHFLCRSNLCSTFGAGLDVVVGDDAIQPGAALERTVDLSPLFAFDAAFAREEDLTFGARPKLALDEPFAQFAYAAFEVLAVDFQRATVFPDAADQEVDVRVVGVVMVNGDPLKARVKIAFHLRNQVTDVSVKIDAVGVFGRHDERPHQLVALLPIANGRSWVETVIHSVESEAPLVSALGIFAAEIARMRGPSPVVAIASV
jgi:hypothetical protein